MSSLPESSFGPFKEHLLLSAKSTSRESPSKRAGMVRAILKHSIFNEFSALRPDLPFELVSESEVFEAAYSDASGVEYFQGWLQDEWEDINRTIDLLSLHLAKQAEAGADWRAAHDAFHNGRLANQLRSAFISAAKSKCDWISCSDTRPEFHNRWISDFISFGPEAKPFEIQAKRLSAIKWMCEQPWFTFCVPNAMRRIIYPLDPNDKTEISIIAETAPFGPKERKRGRRKGTGLQKQDRLFFSRIDEILAKGKANSALGATALFADQIKGTGEEMSRRRCVADLYDDERGIRSKAL